MHGKKKRISAVYSNFGKNTVEQQWLVWLLLLQKTAVFSKIEQSDRIRSDMASGTEIIRSIYKITHFDFLLDLVHDVKRIFICICMCDSDDLLFRFFDRFTEKTNQLI